MEYNPKYPQPFTFSQAIALDPAVALDEIGRLKNSLSHLRRSQNELQAFLASEEDEDHQVSQALKENEITMHDERIFMLKLALTHHGQTTDPFTSSPSIPSTNLAGRPHNAINSSSNGLDDVHPTPTPTLEAEHQENGVYL